MSEQTTGELTGPGAGPVSAAAGRRAACSVTDSAWGATRDGAGAATGTVRRRGARTAAGGRTRESDA